MKRNDDGVQVSNNGGTGCCLVTTYTCTLLSGENTDKVPTSTTSTTARINNHFISKPAVFKLHVPSYICPAISLSLLVYTYV